MPILIAPALSPVLGVYGREILRGEREVGRARVLPDVLGTRRLRDSEEKRAAGGEVERGPAGRPAEALGDGGGHPAHETAVRQRRVAHDRDPLPLAVRHDVLLDVAVALPCQAFGDDLLSLAVGVYPGRVDVGRAQL